MEVERGSHYGDQEGERERERETILSDHLISSFTPPEIPVYGMALPISHTQGESFPLNELSLETLSVTNIPKAVFY